MTSFIQYNVFNSARYCRLLSYERKIKCLLLFTVPNCIYARGNSIVKVEMD
jgi:hypothetical protein